MVVYSTVRMVVTSVAGAVSVDTSVEVTVVVSVSVSMMLCADTSPARRVMRREKGRMVAVWLVVVVGMGTLQDLVGGKVQLG